AADCAAAPAALDAEYAGAVAAATAVRFDVRDVGRVLGEDRNHAARRVAVQRREGTAQDLDARRRQQAEAAGLSLPVRHRDRDAILVKPYAAHAELRARAEAARADLQILRVVLAVRREDARNAHQRLGQVDLRLRIVDRRRVDRVDGCRYVERALGMTRRR